MRLGTRLRGLTLNGRHVMALETGEAVQPVDRRDVVILAVPPWVAGELVPGLTVPNDFRAIVNAHFRMAPPAGSPAMLGVIGGTAEWIFTFPDRISVTVSGADAIVDKDREELARLIWADVAKALEISADMPAWQIVKEKRATFAATPAQDARRPEAKTPWRNLFLAGDWTRTGPARNHRGRPALRRKGGCFGRPPSVFIVGAMNQMSPSAYTDVEGAIRAATDAILGQQKPDGHWVYELEADATIPAEYVLLVHYLAEEPNLELERKIGVYLRRIQGAHGGWPLYHEGAFDISATVKAYFALKMIGDDINAPHMVAGAAKKSRKRGGAIKANVFTRILLALYGQCSWNDVPTVPPELILLPRWFPVHLSKMSYWARTVIVPLLVLCARKPLARNPRGIHVDELFVPGVPAASLRARRTRAPAGRLSSARWTRF